MTRAWLRALPGQPWHSGQVLPTGVASTACGLTLVGAAREDRAPPQVHACHACWRLTHPRKPALTRAVLDGLLTLAALASAGSEEDVLGHEASTPEDRKAWNNVLRACEWARATRDYRRTRAGL